MNFGDNNFNPRAELQRSPILRPDQVRGVLGNAPAERPTRKFHVVDTRGTMDCVWEIDGYLHGKAPDGSDLWLLHLICPQCDRLLSIRGDRKAISVGTFLEVEEFACTWPGTFGQATCSFAAGIVKPKERVIVTDRGRRQLDGAFLRR